MVVYTEGGIYLDTDVEIIKLSDDLLNNSAYFGFENNEYIATGLGFGAEQNHPILKTMIDEYKPLLDGKHGVIMCPRLNTNALTKFNFKMNGEFQKIGAVCVYPSEYFNPYDDPTGRLHITERTYSIHWFSKSWASKKMVIRSQLTKPFHRWFGIDVFKRLKR